MNKPLFAWAVLIAAITGCTAPSDTSEPVAAEAGTSDNVIEMPAGQSTGSATAKSSAIAAGPGSADGQPRLALDPDGLRWFLQPNGRARPLAFGTAQTDLLASLERARGQASEGTNQDCGAGPVQYASWPDGLSLVFQNGRFVGWSLDSRAAGKITSADGIGIGTTRSQLDDAIGPPLEVRQTSLGTEFTAGEYFGLFDGNGGNARITDLWAGVSCVAR